MEFEENHDWMDWCDFDAIPGFSDSCRNDFEGFLGSSDSSMYDFEGFTEDEMFLGHYKSGEFILCMSKLNVQLNVSSDVQASNIDDVSSNTSVVTTNHVSNSHKVLSSKGENSNDHVVSIKDFSNSLYCNDLSGKNLYGDKNLNIYDVLLDDNINNINIVSDSDVSNDFSEFNNLFSNPVYVVDMVNGDGIIGDPISFVKFKGLTTHGHDIMYSSACYSFGLHNKKNSFR